MKQLLSDPIWVCLYHKNDPLSPSERILSYAKSYGAERGFNLPPDLKIVRQQYKKPFFENVPWLHFSVSHSADVWVLAISTLPVGIDTEYHRDCDMAGITKRFFHPQEQLILEKDGYASFFRIWTAKESYVKFAGTGITDNFSSFSVADNKGLIHSLGHVQFHFPTFDDQYTLCLCTQSKGTVVMKDTRL